MKKIRIQLSQPFDQILATVLALPRGGSPESCRASGEDERELKQVLRGLYEAAHGRQVETPLGLVPIAPPVAEYLREAPFEVATQLDFLIAATSLVVTCPSLVVDQATVSPAIGSSNGGLAPLDFVRALGDQAVCSRSLTEIDEVRFAGEGVSHG